MSRRSRYATRDSRSLLFASLDRRAGKAVRSRHCPATVMRNETGIVPPPVKGGKAPA